MVERGGDGLPARQLARMDGDAEPGFSRDLEGTHIVLHLARALVAGDAEAGDARIAAAGGEARRLLDRLDADMAQADHDHAPLDAGSGAGAGDALAERVRIGLRRQAGARGVVGRDEDFRIDRAVAGERGQVVVGQQRIVLFGTEQPGGKVVGRQEGREIVPDKGAVANEGRGVCAVFPCLPDHQIGRCCPLDMTMQLGFQGHAVVLCGGRARGRTPRLKQ